MENTFYIPEGSVGVVTICNNKEGIFLNVFTKNKSHRDILCRVGDMINVIIHTPDSFGISHLSSSKEAYSPPSNFVVAINEKTTQIPFVKGEGSASVCVITMKNGTTTINVGTIVTFPKENPTDYINEELQHGDSVSVSIG
jgi:hypothetical protein